MTDAEIQQLAEEIDSVNFNQFWWGSPLLKRCESCKDPRIVKSLSIRHHCLQNKEADSCHVIRNTIKIIDGPEFGTLWSFITNEHDFVRLIKDIDNPYSLPWAALFILGEIGGKAALSEVTGKLASNDPGRQYVFVRLTLHLMSRYLKILNQDEPTLTVVNVKTGELSITPTRKMAPDMLERQLLRSKQANEYFTEVQPNMLSFLKHHLMKIPDNLFPLAKQQMIQYVDYIPTL